MLRLLHCLSLVLLAASASLQVADANAFDSAESRFLAPHDATPVHAGFPLPAPAVGEPSSEVETDEDDAFDALSGLSATRRRAAALEAKNPRLLRTTRPIQAFARIAPARGPPRRA